MLAVPSWVATRRMVTVAMPSASAFRIAAVATSAQDSRGGDRGGSRNLDCFPHAAADAAGRVRTWGRALDFQVCGQADIADEAGAGKAAA
jgi:hypothetical protein